ncbi:MAG TPA: hypothetical protein VMJ14_05600 [Burkholderiales bacterium]|nr:hypothetical protein [Burkholderiales bacterium]
MGRLYEALQVETTRLAIIRWLTWVLFPCYVAGGIFLVALVTGQDLAGDLGTLGFGFGAAVQDIAEHGHLSDASRNSLIPYSLALLHWLGCNQLACLFIKNLAGQALILASLLIMLRSCGLNRISAMAIGFVLTFPQVFRHSFSLVPEEGWIIPLLALLVASLLCLDLRKNRVCLMVGCLCAALFLLKSSLAALAVAIPALVALNGRTWRRIAAVLAPPAMAIVGWSLHNLAFTGEMNPGNSLTGYDFLKGNYHGIAGFFPFRSLDDFPYPDNLFDCGDRRAEWDCSRLLWARGIAENIQHPLEALQIFALRLYQVWVDPFGQDSSPWAPHASSAGSFLYQAAKLAGIAYMSVFRILLLAALTESINSVARNLTQSIKAFRRGETSPESPLVAKIYFVVLCLSFSLPYLLTWGTERRIIPLVLVTAFYLWTVYGRKRGVRPK